MNASTFTARVIASTGADVAAAISGAIGALSGPLHGGAPSRVLHMLDEVERAGDPVGYVKGVLDRKERLMGFGHRVYRAEDPRARVLRRTAKELGSRRGTRWPRRWRRPRSRSCTDRYPDRPLADERGVLGRGRARLRRGPAAHVHLDVHLRPDRRVERAHPRAEAAGQADPAVGALRRPGAAQARGRRGLDRCPASTRRRRRSRPWRGDLELQIVLPDELKPRDGRFGCGPSKVRPEALAALAAAGADGDGHVAPPGAGEGRWCTGSATGLASAVLAAGRLRGRARQRRRDRLLGRRGVRAGAGARRSTWPSASSARSSPT